MDMIAAINTGKLQFEFEIYTTNQQWNPIGLKGDMLYLQLEHCIHFKLLDHSSRTGDLHSSSGLITSAEQHPHRNQKETSLISI